MIKQRYRDWLLLVVVCVVVFGFKVGDRVFWGRHGESRRAEVSREVVASGEWIIPHLNGDPFISKPPLYYWAAALAFTLSGNIDEFSARIPSLIAGTLGVLLIYLWASAIFSRRVGLLSGIVLATNFLYAGMARTAGVDMMLTLFTTAALCCFSLGVQAKQGPSMYLLAAVWIGLGTMTKNPIGLAVPLLAIAGFILMTRQWKLILDTKPWWGFLIVLGIVLPWALLVYLQVPNFFEVLHQETLGRYTDPEGTPHLEPFYFYIPSLGAFAPWVAFLPAVIISLISQGVRRLSQSHIFLLIASATTFALFSSVGSKREYYLLPLYPLLAILVGKIWDEYLSMKAQTPQHWTWKSVDIPIVGFAGLLCAVGVGLPIAAHIYLPDYLLNGVGFGILFVALGIVLFVLFLRGKAKETFWIYSLATICLYLFVLTTIVPEMDRYRSRKDFFHEVREVVADHPIVDYKYEGFDVQFYLQRLVNYCFTLDELQVFLDQHESVFIITTGKEYDKLQREAPELLEKLDVIQQRTWTSATNPKSQKSLVLLKKNLTEKEPLRYSPYRLHRSVCRK